MGGWNSTLQAARYVRHAHWARLCYVPFVIWWLWITSTMWLLILSSTSFNGRPFALVLYVFLMKCIGRWLPWVLPGSTGRFFKDDVVHNHSAHGYYITLIEGGVRYICMILLHVKQNETKLIKKYHPHSTRIGSGSISYERHFEWWGEQNRCTFDNVKTRGAWCSL